MILPIADNQARPTINTSNVKTVNKYFPFDCFSIVVVVVVVLSTQLGQPPDEEKKEASKMYIS